MSISRRTFLLAAPALSIGCTGLSVRPSPSNAGASSVRAPALGQTWRYDKHELISGKFVDSETERVIATGKVTEIEIQSQVANAKTIEYPYWGNDWLQRYAGPRRQEGIPAREIQVPWGMILMDSHWAQMQVYEKPIPLWPQELRPGWSKTVGVNYKTADSPTEPLPWQLAMHALRWDSVTVPAGTFTALRYFNIINFRYSNVSEKVAAQRLETVWFAPEVGRWVARESQGTFYQDVGERFREETYRWELTEWT